MGHAGPSTDPRTRFVAAVRGNLDRLRGDSPGPGVVAVSGGADSVALLCAFAADPPPGGLVVAHLNHRLRGAYGDADAAFVATLFPDLPHHVEAIDVRAAAAGGNLEATAREVRYAFLARAAAATGAGWVATGHTADDQAETVLHRLIRGSGLRGLRGIAVTRGLAPGVRLVRPMLTVSRDDVIAYLRAAGQAWREDATNRDPALTRNRIRHELLPLTRTFNPAIGDVLGRLAAQADETFREIEAAAADLLRAAECPRVGQVCVLDRPALAAAAPSLVREALNLLWAREGWPQGDLTAGHWDKAAAVVRGDCPAWDLPGGIRIVGTARVIRVSPAAGLTS
jgi:tRNA(Ile)-lysidine synthase